MARVDMAQRSSLGRPHSQAMNTPLDRGVSIQLQFREKSHGTCDIFSCQLFVMQDVWDKTAIGARFKEHTNLREDVGQIALRNDQFAISLGLDHRLLSIFGRYVQVHFDHENTGPKFSLSVKVRVLGVERRTENVNSVWLVRAEILSGGLLCLDVASSFDGLGDIIWPKNKGQLMGIYFTDSELQFDVLDKFNGINRLRRFRMLDVQRDQDGNIEQTLWEQTHGRKLSTSTALSPASPSTTVNSQLLSLNDLCKEMGIVMSPEPKKEDTTAVGRVIARVDMNKGTISEFLSTTISMRFKWKSAKFEGATTNWQPKTIFVDDENFYLIDTDEVAATIRGDAPSDIRVPKHDGAITAIAVNAGVGYVFTSAAHGLVNGERVDIARVNGSGIPPELTNGTYRDMTVSSVSANQFTVLDAGAQGTYDSGGTWSLSRYRSVTHIVWKTGTPVLKKLPAPGLVGVSSGRADAAKDLWFQASSQPANGSPYANQPICWAHIAASEPVGLPLTQISKRDSLQRANLSDPIELRLDETDETYFWNCQIIPSNTAPAAPELNPRPKLLLRIKKKAGNNGDEQAHLVVFQPDVTLKSPPLELYNRPVADPEYVPNERAPHEEAKLVKTSLQFERQAGFEISSDTVQCKLLTGGGIEIEHPERAVEMFFPASQALVDPVSVTAGNLVARQTVAFQLASKELMTDDRPVQLTRISRETNGVTADLEFSVPANVTFDRELVGFFAELVRGGGNEAEVSCVVRLREISPISTDNKLTLKVDVSPTFDDLKLGRYSMFVGPTRLALPRDVNHGLICIGLKKIRFGRPLTGRPLTPTLNFELKTDTATEVRSVLALHPWSEWGPTPGEWLKTGRIRLHHRNLIQEHAEFESSFEDRFPPEGPLPAGNGPKSPLLPLGDFIRAVRDRYTEASGNLLAGAGKQIANWLPAATLAQIDDKAVVKSLTFTPSTVAAPLPETKLDDVTIFPDQSLKLRTVKDPLAAKQWLDANVRVKSMDLNASPMLHLQPTDITAVDSRRALNSSVSLLFNRHEVTVLAAAFQGDQPVLVWGSPSTNPQVGRYLAGNLESQKELAAAPHSCAAALTVEGNAYVGVVATDGAIKLLRVKDNLSTDTLAITAAPTNVRAIVGGAARGTPRFAVIAETPPSVMVIESQGGAHNSWKAVSPPGQSANPTSIALTESEAGGILVVGYPGGKAVLWRHTAGNWQHVVDLPVKPNSPPIRSIAVAPADTSQLFVIGCDGTRDLTLWDVKVEGADGPTAKASRDTRASEALSVVAGCLNDLELRGGDQKDLNFFAIGYRSGELELRGVQDGEMRPIRSFDSPAPVVSLAVIQSPTKQPTAAPLLAVGAPDGNLLAWDLRSGAQFASPERIAPTHYFDGLGVTRQVAKTPGEDPTGKAPLIEKLRSNVEGMNLDSISVDEFVLSLSEQTETRDVTDIRFWSDSLKVNASGKPFPGAFDDDRWFPGRCGFYSQVRVPDDSTSRDDQNLRALNYLPRLGGIPLFVTRLDHITTSRETIEVTDDDGDVRNVTVDWIAEIQFDAVLVNPDEIAAGFDPADEGTTPGYVRQALSRGSVVTVKVSNMSPGKTSQVEIIDIETRKSKVDWIFAVNRQRPRRDLTAGFPGSIARIKSKSVSFKNGQVKIVVDLIESRALVFDRLWGFRTGEVELIGSGRFEAIGAVPEHNVTQGWRPLDFEFRSTLPSAVDKPIQVFPEDNQDDLVAIKDSPFAMDTDGNLGRFIPIIPEDSGVLLVDRITGLADRGTLRLIGENLNENSAKFTSAAIIETAEQVTLAAARARGMVREGNQDIEVGDVEFYFDPRFDAYGRPSSDPDLQPKRLTWRSTLLAGDKPVVKLARLQTTSGAIAAASRDHGNLRLQTEDVFFPAPGQKIGLNRDNDELLSGFVLTNEDSFITLAKNADWGGSNPAAQYFQPAAQVTDSRIDEDHKVVTAKHLDRELRVGDFVAIGDKSSPPCVEVIAVDGDKLKIGKDNAVKIGDRLFGVRQNTGGMIGETLRLQTRTDGLKPGSRVRLHDLTANTAELCLVGAVAAGAVDLYTPVPTTAPADPMKFFWRAVSPIAGFLSDGAAGLRIPGHGLDLGAKIRVAAVQVDAGSSLNRDWVAIPRPDDPTNLVLLGLPKEGNAPYTSGGTWIRKGLADPKAIAGASNPGPGLPIVITTEVDHDLEPGELVEISGVDGNTAANGDAIVGVVTPNTFELYSITEPPTNPVGGDWGELMLVSAAQRTLSSLRITSNPKPTLGQQVRVTDNEVESDVLNAVVLEGNQNTWDLAKAITTPLADFARSGWSLPNPIRLINFPQSADGQTTLQLLAEGDSLPFGQALLLLDDGGANPNAGKMLVADPRDVDTLIVLEEVSDDLSQNPPDRWGAKTVDTLAVVNPGGNQLFFGEPPNSNRPGTDPKKLGWTSGTHQLSNIQHFGVGLCGPTLAAVTVDGEAIRIWSLEEIIEKVEPTQTLPINKEILGLAVGQSGPLLLIGVVTANAVDVFIGGDPSGPFDRVTIAATGVANDPLLAFCTDAEVPVIVLGRKTSKNISMWTIDSANRTATPYFKFQSESPVKNLIAGTLDRGLQLVVQTTNGRVSRWGKNSWLHFSSQADVTFAPQAALDVDVEYKVAAVGEILAKLTPARDVQVTMAGEPAHARLLQDIGRCFTLKPTSANAARGKETLVLWPVGDLSVDSIATAGPLQLGAMHSVLEQEQVPVELKVAKDIPGLATLQGAYLTYRVAASLGRGKPVFHRSSTIIAAGKLGSDQLTVILEGSSEGAPGEPAEFTGTLLCDNSPKDVVTVQFQATVRAKVTFAADDKVIVALEDDTYWTVAAKPGQADREPSIFLPVGPNESTSPPNFAVAPFEVDNAVEGNFVRLRFITSGQFPGLHLNTNTEGSVPLIPDLELDKVAPPLRQARNTVRLTHRLRAGVALRPDLPTDPFSPDGSTFKAKKVILTGQSHWLLEPIVYSQNGSLIRIRPEAWLIPLPNHGMIRHIAPIAIGAKQGAEIRTLPHSLAPAQRIRLRDSEGKSVGIVELSDVTNEDQAVGKFRAFITKAVQKRIENGSWEAFERTRRETDGLLVLVRMPSGPELSRALGSFIVALDSRTHVDEIPPATLDMEMQGQYRQLLLDTGVRGVSVQYRLEDYKAPDFAFVASPFFDHGDRETTLSVDGILAAVSAAVTQETIVQILDRFLVSPVVAAFESQAVASRYTPDSTPADPYADVCCLAHRMFRLRRIGPAPEFSNKQIPVVHLSTVPAFRQSAPLLPAAGRNWRRTKTGPLGPRNGNHAFFPPTLDWTIAADKPGAMFHALIQPRVQNRNGSEREPVLDFAQREPQFIRIKDCVTAAVAWEKVEPRTMPNSTHLDLKMMWEETIGTAEVKVAKQFMIEQVSPREFKLKVSPEDSKLDKRPLQLIESFNDEVIAVQPADAAVPAYRVVAQPHPVIQTQAVTVRPADTYLVADKDADIFAAKSLALTGDAKISPVDLGDPANGGIANVAKFESVKLQDLRDGEILSLSGFGETSGLNGRRVRVVRRLVDGDDFWILGEDTARIDFAANNITLDPEADAPDIICEAGVAGTIERPLSLKPDSRPKSGTLVTVPANTVANARTGEPITQCICWLEGETIVLLAPLIVAASEEEEAEQTSALVVPYFEASPRLLEIEITIDPDPIWLGALRIEKRDVSSAEMLPIDIDWIRCESAKIPELTGIFRTLPIKDEATQRQLVHPSLIPSLFGDSGEIPVEGVLKLFEGKQTVGSASITLVELRPGLPARIKVEGADAFLDLFLSGSAVSVVLTKVEDVDRSGTPLDGMWVIERFEDNGDLWLELFAATVAPPDHKDPKSPVVVSRVSPLIEAFGPATVQGEYALATLNAEVCDYWIPISRPLLQVQWAGLRTEPNADGSKLTPRQVGLLIPLFEDPKQIKFLANSQLPPKLSFVLSAGRTDAADKFALQRTILFGDSAPPFAAKPNIDGDLFVLKIPHNKEELSVEIPKNLKLNGAKLFIVKSLPSGVLVYDEHTFPN